MRQRKTSTVNEKLIVKAIEALNESSKLTFSRYSISYSSQTDCYCVRILGRLFYGKDLVDAIGKAVGYVAKAEMLIDNL